MNIAVRYHTRSGNTKKLAEAIADAVGVRAHPVTTPLSEKVDILFLGNSMYGADVDDAVKNFLRSNASSIGKIVNISTAAIAPSTYKMVAKLAKEYNINMATEEFHCRGSFMFMHKNRPNAEDLQKAAAFAKGVAGK